MERDRNPVVVRLRGSREVPVVHDPAQNNARVRLGHSASSGPTSRCGTTVGRAREIRGCPLMSSKFHNLYDSHVDAQRRLNLHLRSSGRHLCGYPKPSSGLDGMPLVGCVSRGLFDETCIFPPRSQVIGRSGMGDHIDRPSSFRAVEQPL